MHLSAHNLRRPNIPVARFRGVLPSAPCAKLSLSKDAAKALAVAQAKMTPDLIRHTSVSVMSAVSCLARVFLPSAPGTMWFLWTCAVWNTATWRATALSLLVGLEGIRGACWCRGSGATKRSPEGLVQTVPCFSVVARRWAWPIGMPNTQTPCCARGPITSPNPGLWVHPCRGLLHLLATRWKMTAAVPEIVLTK